MHDLRAESQEPPSEYSSSSTLSDTDIPNDEGQPAGDVRMRDDITDSTPAVELWVPNAFFQYVS